MAARIVGRDGDDLLIADGQAGAIVQPGRESVVMPLGSIVAHREFDSADEPFTEDLGLIARLAEYRRQLEPVSPTAT